MAQPQCINFVVTCEHGGNEVPAAYKSRFDSSHAKAVLKSHRGFDVGALDAAKIFATALETKLIASKTTRLLVDLNRSLGNTDLFSEFTRDLSTRQKASLLDHWYFPYRKQVEQRLRRQVNASGNVVHLSIHTFTPRFKGSWRPIDVGLLFDPARSQEVAFCDAWQSEMSKYHRPIRVLHNEPYRGIDDGFTTALRRKLPKNSYLGIEVEINHRFAKRSVETQSKITEALLKTIPKIWIKS